MSNLMSDDTKRYREKKLICLALLVSVFLGSIDMIEGSTVGCGTVGLRPGLIMGGKTVLRDEWPFIAALFRLKPFKYFCGGTIISNKHVLTAAHCIHGKFSAIRLSPDKITVRLGAYNLTASNESDVVVRNVTEIHIHPDWDVLEEKYDADIAVLVLNENVTFSISIRPVCMPMDDVNIDGVKGMVVGWGVTDDGPAGGIPRKTETTALNDSYCYRQDNVISSYLSERSFCGVGDGTPNEGDSGGGFFAVTGSAWVQYGTVCLVRTNPTGHVVTGVFAAYTKLTSVKQWIADTVSSSGSSISEATMKINLHCTYKYDDAGLYGCWLSDQNIRKPNYVVDSTAGSRSHDHFKGDVDVELIVFESGTMFFLPDNIGNIFQNLTYLTVGKLGSQSIGTKHIFRSNFQSLEHLKDIKLFNNDIEELDEDSLWDLSELQSFRLEKSNLRSLNATTFSKNSNLTIVYVLSSVLRTLPRNLFENNPLLESVAFDSNSIVALDDGTFDKNTNLKSVSFQRNRLERLSNNLFQNNSALKYADFSYNAIKTIGEQTFRTNSKLRTLFLQSNELEYLPSDIFQDQPLLDFIDFGNNSIKSIDDRLLETNAKAREIHLWSNQLKTLPSNLFHKNLLLNFVNLDTNFIETIDEKLFETNRLLRKVYFKFNQLNQLPGHLFKNSSNLVAVNFRSNFLKEISVHTFETNKKLIEVNFEGNYLTFLPSELFRSNLLLQKVNFANNSLRTIEDQVFQMNSNLRYLDLSSNLLDSLSTHLFRNNLKLEIVDLSNNFIKTIEQNTFFPHQRLTDIFLQRNQLQSLLGNLFQGNKNLRNLHLNGNQLKVIEIVFTEFENVNFINLYENDCVDAAFINDDGSDSQFQNMFHNLTEFQDLIQTYCNSDLVYHVTVL